MAVVVVVVHATCTTDRPFAFGSFAFAKDRDLSSDRVLLSLSRSFLPPLSLLLFHRARVMHLYTSLSLSQSFSSSLFLLSSPPFIPSQGLFVHSRFRKRERKGGSRRRRQHTIGIHRAHVPRTFTCRHNAAPNRSRGIVIQIVAYSTTIHKHCR